MRIFRLFIVLAIIAGVAYYYVWNKHAVQTQEIFEQRIVALNEKHKGAEGAKPDLKITYESAERGGFPFGVSLNLKNPVVSYNSDFTKNMFLATPLKEQEDATAPLYTHMSLDGNMLLKTNYMQRTLEIIPTGRWTTEMPTGDDGSAMVMKSKSAHTDGCKLKLNKQAAWSMLNDNFFVHIESLKDVADNFEEIACEGDGYTLMNRENGNPLISLSPYKVGFASRSMDEKILDMSFHAKMKDVEFSQEYIDWYNGYSKKLYSSMYGQKMATQLAGMNMMTPGKQLFDIDIDVKMPKKPGSGLAEKSRINASSFKIDNVMYRLDLPFSYSLTKTGSNSDYSFKLQGELEHKKTMRDYVSPLVKTLVVTSSLGNSKTAADRQKVIEFSEKLDENPEILEPLIPKLDELGIIKFDFDMVAGAKKDETGFDNGGKLDIKSANITNDLYSIRSGGEFDIGKLGADFVMRIEGGDQLIEDVVGYLKRLHEITPVKADIKYEFNDLIIKKMQSLFTQLADLEDLGKTWVIRLEDNGQKQLVINGKPMLEVMMLAIQTFSPDMNVHRYKAPQNKVKRPSAN